MTVPHWVWPAIITASAIVIGVLVFGEVASPIRPIVTVWFLTFCPGIALVRLLRLREVWAEVTLAAAVSLSLDVGVASMLLYSGYWSPKLGLAILISVSLVGAALQLRGVRWRSTEAGIADSCECEEVCRSCPSSTS
jgi:uncharacterized membrane protein